MTRDPEAGATDRAGRLLRFPTEAGDACIVLESAGIPRTAVLLGHGAGGGIEAPDLLAVRNALVGAGVAVARMVQPYRLAGRRTPPPARVLDAAWLVGVERLRAEPGLGDAALVVGGRSSGARVACRTAATVGAVGVVALAFPLAPPGRPERSRIAELLGVERPTLVVQGTRDAFGSAAAVREAASGPSGRLPAWLQVAPVAGADHGFSVRRAEGRSRAECVAEVAAAVAGFVAAVTG